MGTWKKGHLDGYCIVKYANGDIFKGEFKQNKQVRGTIYFVKSGEQYDGEWKNGQMTGTGTYRFSSTKVYTGQVYDGEPYGQGVLKTDKFRYTGHFKGGMFEGDGMLEDFQTGQTIRGLFKDGKLERASHFQKQRSFN